MHADWNNYTTKISIVKFYRNTLQLTFLATVFTDDPLLYITILKWQYETMISLKMKYYVTFLGEDREYLKPTVAQTDSSHIQAALQLLLLPPL